MEPKLFGDLESEPKINLNKYFLQSVWTWRMLGRRKANFYLYQYSTTVLLRTVVSGNIHMAGSGAGAEIMDKVGAEAENK